MAEGRSRALWQHTSNVLALLANVNRDPKKSRAFRPSDFNPHAPRRKPPSVEQLTREILKVAETKKGRQGAATGRTA